MMEIGCPFIIFITLITGCFVKTITSRYHPDIIPPDFRMTPNFFNTNNPHTVSKPIITTTTTTLRPVDISTFSTFSTFSPILYDYIFSFSNVGLQKIGPNFIISDKVISLSLDNNEISYISPYAFRRIPNLKHLNLSGNRIPTERLLSFVNVDGLQTLVIDNNNPTNSKNIVNDINNSYDSAIDYGIFRRLEHLHICNSQLQDFQIHQLSVPALTHLYLSNNSIKSSDVFNNIPNTLTNLFLNNNLIDRVGNYKLRYLRYLNMDNNIITEVCFEDCAEQSISLRGANNMETLSLSRNLISKVSADAFKDTKRLTYLDLSENNITEVFKSTFNNTTWMKRLSLADNKLTTIPMAICSLTYLISLNLTGNYIGTIHANNYCHLIYLESLCLANNKLTVIGSHAFTNFRTLKHLDLSGNQLLQLPPQWATTSLEKLHLEKNNFEELDDVTLVNMMKLKDLYLNDNPMLTLKAASFKSLPMHLTLHVENMRVIYGDDYNKTNGDANDIYIDSSNLSN